MTDIIALHSFIAYHTETPQIHWGFWEIFIKIMIPAAMLIVIKIAIQNRHQKISKSGVFASITSGLGLAYLSGKLILNHIPDEWIGLVAGGVALAAEHVIGMIIYRFKWDVLGDALFEALKNWVLRKTK